MVYNFTEKSVCTYISETFCWLHYFVIVAGKFWVIRFNSADTVPPGACPVYQIVSILDA